MSTSNLVFIYNDIPFSSRITLQHKQESAP